MNPRQQSATRRRLSILTLLAPLAACAASDRAIEVREVLRATEDAGISIAELRASGDASFGALDADGDGMITEAEFAGGDLGSRALARGEHAMVFVHEEIAEREAEAAMAEAEVAMAEAERALRVDITEKEARAFHLNIERDDAGAFAAMDSDGDGLLSLEEYENRTGPAAFPFEVPHIEIDAVASAFEGFDANEDGVITRDEWPSPERHLAALDLDGDGILALEELAQGEHRRIEIERRVRKPE